MKRDMVRKWPNERGFTIVAYNGIQQRARDAQRKSDIDTIAKALEMYYIDNGAYLDGNGSTTISGS